MKTALLVLSALAAGAGACGSKHEASTPTSTTSTATGTSSTGGGASGGGGSTSTGTSSGGGMMPAKTQPFGVSLEALNNYAVSQMLTDVVRGSEFGSVATPWDRAVPLDKDGWPKTDFGFVAFTNLPSAAGAYHLSFKGQAKLDSQNSNGTVTIDAQKYDAATGITTATVNVSQATTTLMLELTNTGGGARDIHLWRPGYAADQQRFTDVFLSRLQPFRVLRTLDPQAIVGATDGVNNGNEDVVWADRAKPSDATWATAHGMPLEILVELANTAHKDLWVNIPTKASDEYAEKMGAFLHAGLEPGRLVYFEWSNEVWNDAFLVHKYNEDLALAESKMGPSPLNENGTLTDPYLLGTKRHARRAMEVALAFRKGWGEKEPERVRPLLAQHFEEAGLADVQLRWLEQYYGPPSKLFYGLATAPYITLPDQLNMDPNLTVAQVLAACHKSADAIESRFGADPSWKPTGPVDWQNPPTYQTMARHWGLKSVFYEGGEDLTGEASSAAKIAANHTDEMGAMLAHMIHAYYDAGNDLFMFYMLAEADVPATMNGLYTDITKDTPKSLAVVAAAKSLK